MTKKAQEEYHEKASSWERAFSMHIMVAIKLRNWTVERTAKEAGISKVTLYKIMQEDNYTAKTLFKVMNVLGLTVNFEFTDQELWEKARATKN